MNRSDQDDLKEAMREAALITMVKKGGIKKLVKVVDKLHSDDGAFKAFVREWRGEFPEIELSKSELRPIFYEALQELGSILQELPERAEDGACFDELLSELNGRKRSLLIDDTDDASDE